MAEAEIALLSRQALDQRLPDADAVRRALAAWERPNNDAGATVTWRFTVKDARRKLKGLYPSSSPWSRASSPAAVSARRPCSSRASASSAVSSGWALAAGSTASSVHPRAGWRKPGRLQQQVQQLTELHLVDPPRHVVVVHPVNDDQIRRGYRDHVVAAVADGGVGARRNADPPEKSALGRGRPPHVTVTPQPRLAVGGLSEPRADPRHVRGRARPDPVGRDDLAVAPGPPAEVEEAEARQIARAHPERIPGVVRQPASTVLDVLDDEVVHPERRRDALLESLADGE